MTPNQPRSRVLLAGAIGNLVEWYDFALYAYAATSISTAFFPKGNASVALLGTLAVFGVSFLLRPVGGLVFGRLGDRVGRARVLSLVVLGMGAATTIMGLVPSYSTIGFAAPVLLVLTRLAQGFFSGGEYTGASTFLVEYAPPGRRGQWAGISVATGILPFAFAGFVVLAFSTSMPPDVYANWGWRLPFLLSAPFALVGLYLRKRIADTPAFKAVEREESTEASPLRTVLREHKGAVLVVFAIAALNSVASYSLTSYMPTHLKQNVGLGANLAAVTNSVVVVLFCVLVPFFGRLSDVAGRRRVLLLGVGGLALLSIPAYLLLSLDSVPSAIAGQLLLALPAGCLAAVLTTVMCELFPTRVRYSGASMGYNLAYALLGGTAPLVAQLLVAETGVHTSPGWYLAILAVLVAPVLFFLPETSKQDLTGHDKTPATAGSQEVSQ